MQLKLAWCVSFIEPSWGSLAQAQHLTYLENFSIQKLQLS